MRLQTKLMLGPWITTAMLLLAVTCSAGLLYQYSHQSKAQQEAAAEVEAMLDQTQTGLAREHGSLYRTMTIVASVPEAKLVAQRRALPQDIARLVDKALDVSRRLGSADAAAAAKVMQAAAARFVKAADMALDMGSVDANTGIAALQTADAEHHQVATAIAALYGMSREHHARAAESLRARAQWLTIVMGVLALVTAGAALVVSGVMKHRIVRDVRRVSHTASRVADGWLDRVEHDDSDDDIGELLRTQATMVQHLREMVSQVTHSAGSIRGASAEVASGNTDLSQRTEQAAANLQRTASSMTQLTGNVRQSADSAAQANQLAHSASDSAQRGGAVMTQVVSNMQDIATSSKRIADIIGTIDGIAFQTNILALNAAVEAARAGEQGRGFAVVAGEVRLLAQRSAEAAREIKTLIGASVQKVESGTQLVQDAGKTMDEIVSGVQRVSDIIGEISAAAGEQTSGIEQVNGAVNELERMTQQNAALVEQSAAAAESLREQAQKLTVAVAGFKIDGAVGAPAQAMPKAHAPAPAVAHVAAASKAIAKARHVTPPVRAPKPTHAPARSSAASTPTASTTSAQTADGEWESF